jgi:gas vesicle protein
MLLENAQERFYHCQGALVVKAESRARLCKSGQCNSEQLLLRVIATLTGESKNQMAKTDMKQAAVFLFAGAMVGSAVALLCAPQSGARTTKGVNRFARKTVNRLEDLQGDIHNRVADWVDDMTEIVKDGVSRGKKLSTEGSARLLQSFDNVKKCVEDGRSRLEQLIKTT